MNTEVKNCAHMLIDSVVVNRWICEHFYIYPEFASFFFSFFFLKAAKISEGESKLKFFSPDINSILLE